MKITKKIYLFLSIFGLLFFATPGLAVIDLGGDLLKDTSKEAGYSENTDSTTFAENVGYAVRLILSFVGILFIVLMVYAGILWMTARGEEGQVEKSQKIIIAALIGLIITLGAYSISNFVVPAILSRTSG